MTASSRIPWLLPLLFALLILGLGGLGGVAFGAGGQGWYQALQRPPGTPPPWVFGPVWSVLYAMMGVSLGLLVRDRKRVGSRLAITVFIFQLVLNFAWTPLFFGAHRAGLALIDIVAMWLCIAGTIVLAKKVNATAGRLLVPYLVWVSYATYLNAGFWWLNR
jgi:translocator protein